MTPQNFKRLARCMRDNPTRPELGDHDFYDRRMVVCDENKLHLFERVKKVLEYFQSMGAVYPTWLSNDYMESVCDKLLAQKYGSAEEPE